jgi:hypothetical protein
MTRPSKIIILCHEVTPRIKYVTGFLSAVLKAELSPVRTDGFIKNSAYVDTPIICYGSQPVEDKFNIFASGLLTEKHISVQKPKTLREQDKTLLFPAPKEFDLLFDILSAVFYMLSRYEEYLPFKPDSYGRFEAGQSFAYQNGFIEDPVVDQWVELLENKLTERFPTLYFSQRKFSFTSTFDIDSPWAFLHKGWVRTSTGLLKDIITINIKHLIYRLQVITGKVHDPFDTYDYIQKTEKQMNLRSLFFFLSGNKGKFDMNYALQTTPFKELLSHLKAENRIGIHFSCESTLHPDIIQKEYERFSKITEDQPTISRQHYLMLHFPATYRQLIKLGIEEDYSMGYASHPGFRAGTSMPFRFYDLMKEQETRLMIHPFAIMDVTLRQYLGLSPVKAIQKIKELKDKVKSVNGSFIILWHNESLSEYGVWKGWRKVWEEMMNDEFLH